MTYLRPSLFQHDGFVLGFHDFQPFDAPTLLQRAFQDADFSTSRHFDLDETDESFILTLELPGFKQENVEVSLDKAVLLVSAKRGERSYSQSVTLPEGVDPDKIEAKLEDGLLLITLGKKELEKPRKIAIK